MPARSDRLFRIPIIASPGEIGQCDKFKVEQYNWGGEYRPHTSGQLAVCADGSFYAVMTCFEKAPGYEIAAQDGPVYRDSAMEVFIQPYPAGENKSTYMNFEMNSGGVLLAEYGPGRGGRRHFPSDIRNNIKCRVTTEEGRWNAELMVPPEAVFYTCGRNDFAGGDRIRFNFYKISEQHEPVHFGSLTEITSPVPDFHLPEFFAEGLLFKADDRCKS
jgi:hypothetical protein